MKRDVFISYSTKDTDSAKAIMNHLEGAGLKCWFAPHDIRPSENYHRTLVEAINECIVVLLVLSKASNASADVLSEIAHADLRGKQIVVAALDDEGSSDALRPKLVGCERVYAENLSNLKDAVLAAKTRAMTASRSSLLALVLSFLPGCGLLFVGKHCAGAVLLAAGLATLAWSYFLELGTTLDRVLSEVFHVLIYCSVALTAHYVLGAVSGSRVRVRRWMPYVASVFVPAAGVSFAGRRRCGLALCWISIGVFALMMCAGSRLTVRGCCIDACLWWIVWLVGIAESGFEDAAGRHRNPYVYIGMLLLSALMIYANVPR